MLALKQWVDSLQNSVEFDPETGFLASLPTILPLPREMTKED